MSKRSCDPSRVWLQDIQKAAKITAPHVSLSEIKARHQSEFLVPGVPRQLLCQFAFLDALVELTPKVESERLSDVHGTQPLTVINGQPQDFGFIQVHPHSFVLAGRPGRRTKIQSNIDAELELA